MAKKLILWLAAGGGLLSLGSCTSDLGYYVVETLVEYLPDLLDTYLESTT